MTSGTLLELTPQCGGTIGYAILLWTEAKGYSMMKAFSLPHNNNEAADNRLQAVYYWLESYMISVPVYNLEDQSTHIQ